MGRRQGQSRGTKVAPGIWRDHHGNFSVIVHVKGKAHEKRFPPHTPLEELHAAQAEALAYHRRAAMYDRFQAPKPERGTLAGDVALYLRTREGRSGYKADRSHLAAWCQQHGNSPRPSLTPQKAAQQISAWIAGKTSPRTIKHRVRAAKELWHFHDGKHRRTPFDGLSLPRTPKTIPAPIDEAVILAVADSLKSGLVKPKRHGPKKTVAETHHAPAEKTYARFLIRALSGQRPSQIGRAVPTDIDRENRVWWVRPGKGGNPVPFPLDEELDLAFQYFDKVQAWGTFDCCAFSKTIKRHGWPKQTRPYALRHSFAIRRLLAGVDLGDLQGLLGHTNPTTTRIYAPVLVARLREAMTKKPLRLVKNSA